MLLLLALLNAHAGSLDVLEVGGLWGTPAATGPTAVWFNPAALGFERGTRFLVEATPALGGFQLDRDEPVDPRLDEGGHEPSFVPYWRS